MRLRVGPVRDADAAARARRRAVEVRERAKVAERAEAAHARAAAGFEARAQRRAAGIKAVPVGDQRCPRLPVLARPAYNLYAQVHRNRLAGMLADTSVLGSLSLICVIGSQPEPSSGTYGLRGQVSAGDEVWYSTQPFMDVLLQEEFELPLVLKRMRQVMAPPMIDSSSLRRDLRDPLLVCVCVLMVDISRGR